MHFSQVRIDWIKFHNQPLRGFQPSLNIFGWPNQGEICGAYGTCGENEKCVQGFGGGNLKERTTWKTQLQMGFNEWLQWWRRTFQNKTKPKSPIIISRRKNSENIVPDLRKFPNEAHLMYHLGF